MNSCISEIISRYIDVLQSIWWWQAALVLVVCFWGWLYFKGWFATWKDPRIFKVVPVFLLLFFIVGGIYLAMQKLSLVDDAYISFRYARNLMEGNGLVYNLGERVEGYTNFLWTVLIAGLMVLTGVDAPQVAAYATFACTLIHLVVVFLIGRRLATSYGVTLFFPWAAILLAVHPVFTTFASTGMETMAASMLVSLGVLFFLYDSTRSAFFSGLFFVLAVMTRPDMGIFLVSAAIPVFAQFVLPSFRKPNEEKRKSLQRAVSFCLPLVLLGLYLVWKYSYYGSILPNTFYAKEAGANNFTQGLVYAASFYLGSHFWIAAILCVTWLFTAVSGPGERRFKLFLAVSFLCFNLYVIKVGGDFMFGRFYLPLLPLVLLGVESLFHFLLSRFNESQRMTSASGAVLVACCMAATAINPQFLRGSEMLCGITNENEHYRVYSLKPLVIASGEYNCGRFFKKFVARRGISPTAAAFRIGMTGYYSGFPLVDIHGLTDPHIARMKNQGHHRIGHKKIAEKEYLLEKGVQIIQGRMHPQPYLKLASLKFLVPVDTGIHWYFLYYDRDLVRTLKEKVPEIEFLDFEVYLDEYISGLEQMDHLQVQKDLAWFDEYYFRFNDDPVRREKIRQIAGLPTL